MTFLTITKHRRDVDMNEAVELANAPAFIDGVIENLRATIELQNRMIARMLMVQFGQYGDEFNPGHEPATDADRLSFILDATVIASE